MFFASFSCFSNGWTFNHFSRPFMMEFQWIILGSRTSVHLVLDKNELPVPVNAQTAVIYTSIDEERSIGSMINIYPNPANDVINIKCPDLIKEITVTDILGKRIFNKNVMDMETSIDVGQLTSAIYFFRIKTEKNIFNKKILIR